MPVTIILRGLDFALLSCCPIQVIEMNQMIHASELASAVREAVTGLVSTTRSSHSEGESSALSRSHKINHLVSDNGPKIHASVR